MGMGTGIIVERVRQAPVHPLAVSRSNRAPRHGAR